ncbi:hypothetical protein [Croceitalea dokdonensis]|uniref:hypothetical protein n=1 Tax=Croceitalea dokdonensis TaxID=346188 RepID=UPI0006CA2AD9|nr:hypothetical protein [Croceitalea dokdonensis]
MKTRTVLVLLTGICCFTLQAQKKSELIAKVGELENTVRLLNDSISIAQRQIKSANAKAELFEKENTDLRAANNTLLSNLTNFSKISKQNTESVNSALTSLKKKEEQLRVITDTFSKNDSIAIAIFTQIKQTMGPEVKAGVSNGSVIVSGSFDQLFGGDSAAKLTEDGTNWTTKIGEIIKANPDRAVVVEGLNITGELDITYAQAAAVANGLSKTDGVDAGRIQLVVKDGNFKEGINVKLAPDHQAFYSMVKKEFQ